jgi:hypothetical protein
VVHAARMGVFSLVRSLWTLRARYGLSRRRIARSVLRCGRVRERCASWIHVRTRVEMRGAQSAPRHQEVVVSAIAGRAYANARGPPGQIPCRQDRRSD